MSTKTVTKTEMKPKPARQGNKPAAATKPKTLFYAVTLADCLMGKFGPMIQRFYVNACAYHLQQRTTFPRLRLKDKTVMKEADVPAWLKKHEQTSIPAGNKDGQRLFDEMMVQTQKMPRIVVKEPVRSAPKVTPVAPVASPAPELIGPPAPVPA